MRSALLRLATLVLPLLLAACGDLPTTLPAPDVIGVGPGRSGECTLQGDGTFLCAPQQPDWGDECDAYHFDCGGDCLATASGVGQMEGASVQGCPGGGEGPGGTIGDGGGEFAGGGGSGGDGSQNAPGTGPYAEGPLLWAACVLAVVGADYSVAVVGDKFKSWYDAHKALVRARRALDYALYMQREGYYIEPHDLDMAYYRLEVAAEARDTAVSAVEEATGVSILTLIGAAFACGAAAAAPSP